jgi:lysophospholipase L1-like esterase
MALQSSRKKGCLFALLAVAIASVATLAALELFFYFAFRHKWPKHEPIPTMEWVVLTEKGRRLRPDVDFEQVFPLSNRLVRFRTNDLGLRGGQLSREKKPGTTRILALGDSITLASYLPEPETYPALLQGELSRSRNVEVINAGVSDMGTKEEIWLLKDYLFLKPDIVLLGFYLNDSRPPWGFEGEYYRLPPWLVEFSKRMENVSYLYRFVWKRYLVRKYIGHNLAARLRPSEVYASGEWRTDRQRFIDLVKDTSLDWGAAWIDDRWPPVLTQLDEMQKLSKENGFKTGIIIFPARPQVESQVADDKPQKTLLEYCSRNGLPCLDLLPVLKASGREDLFYDQCHLTADGMRVISTPLAEFVDKNFLK